MRDGISVYVFGTGDGLVKVGVSGDTKARAAQLRTGLPNGRMLYERTASVLRGRKAERIAHRLLSAHCIGGEWFATDADTAILAVDGAIDSALEPRIPETKPRADEHLFSWVRVCRIVMGWTIKELAERSVVSVGTINRAEGGDENITCGVADKMLRAFLAVGWTIEQTIPGILSDGLVLHAPNGHMISIVGGVPLFRKAKPLKPAAPGVRLKHSQSGCEGGEA